jgi:hypothetical protein
MPIPPIVFSQILRIVTRLAPLAYKTGRLIRKTDVVWIRDFEVTIMRRSTLGADGAVSQMVKIYRRGVTKEEIWHMVVRAGKIIHKNIK